MTKMIEVSDEDFEEVVLKNREPVVLAVWARECADSDRFLKKVLPRYLRGYSGNCVFAAVALKTIGTRKLENPTVGRWLRRHKAMPERFPAVMLIHKRRVEKSYAAEGSSIEQGVVLGRLVGLGKCMGVVE